jgi:hypothetical protein
MKPLFAIALSALTVAVLVPSVAAAGEKASGKDTGPASTTSPSGSAHLHNPAITGRGLSARSGVPERSGRVRTELE